jgi:hypothetical protein
LSGGGLVPLEGLHHVWYEGFSLGDDLLEVLIVGMSSRPIQAAEAESLRMSGIR